MTIKKLQNNFTTPEQSKRLLELGLPADSADCYYMAIGLDAEKYGYSDFPYFITTNYVDKEHVIAGVNIPCWSVGRLIEIIRLCHDDTASLVIQGFTPYHLVGVISCQVNLKHFDFSKLEE